MKKAINILWTITVIGIVVFVMGLFVAGSDVIRWRIFSITMPIVGIGFWGAVILSVIDYVMSKK